MTVDEWRRKNPPIRKRPQTNYDCLISKTPEEMAEYLSSICYELWKMFCDDPKRAWLDWLKSPVEVEE